MMLWLTAPVLAPNWDCGGVWYNYRLKLETHGKQEIE
jgi:hypothetical protein